LPVPAFRVAAVDTTGAGDAFHAGYAHALGAGAELPEALRSGCAVAALACTALGGRAGLPDRAALGRLLASGTP
jgi:sugar/nucleoside kinase (ribokinase family)